MKTRYKIFIPSIGILILFGWTITEGSLSGNPTMMCYYVYGCTPVHNPNFLSCISTEIEGKSIIAHCADPEKINYKNGCVHVEMFDNRTKIHCSDY